MSQGFVREERREHAPAPVQTLAVVSCPGVCLPAPCATLGELIANELRRSSGLRVRSVAAEVPVAGGPLSEGIRGADCVIALCERAEQTEPLRSALGFRGAFSPRVLWVCLQGPSRRRGPSPAGICVRVRLDEDPRLRPDTAAAPPPEELLATTRSSLARVARAVLGRRVGVALGAGGAWAFSHVSLLLALIEQGIPIDAVAGSSFGALVGAYFCVHGKEGLLRLSQQRLAVGRAARRAVISMTPLERYLDRELAGALLEELDVPLLSVALSLDDGGIQIPGTGRVAGAVRMSGSFPGVFGPTRAGTGRVVDGCVCAPVPDSVFDESFGMIIASNAIPPPSPRPRRDAVDEHPIHRWIQTLNPLARARDLARSAHYFMHLAGERGPAHVRFRLERADAALWDFDQVDDILHRSEPAARACAAEVRTQWEALCSSRTQ